MEVNNLTQDNEQGSERVISIPTEQQQDVSPGGGGQTEISGDADEAAPDSIGADNESAGTESIAEEGELAIDDTDAGEENLDDDQSMEGGNDTANGEDSIVGNS